MNEREVFMMVLLVVLICVMTIVGFVLLFRWLDGPPPKIEQWPPKATKLPGQGVFRSQQEVPIDTPPPPFQSSRRAPRNVNPLPPPVVPGVPHYTHVTTVTTKRTVTRSNTPDTSGPTVPPTDPLAMDALFDNVDKVMGSVQQIVDDANRRAAAAIADTPSPVCPPVDTPSSTPSPACDPSPSHTSYDSYSSHSSSYGGDSYGGSSYGGSSYDSGGGSSSSGGGGGFD